jgi:hypothetical protein
MENSSLIAKATKVMGQYIPNFNKSMFEEFLNYSMESLRSTKNIRYISLEDENMCSEGLVDEYVAHFHSPKEYITIWEEDCYDCGLNPEDLDENSRKSYSGLIDLKDEKYLRFNGHGKFHEYGAKKPPVEDPNWKLWTNK